MFGPFSFGDVLRDTYDAHHAAVLVQDGRPQVVNQVTLTSEGGDLQTQAEAVPDDRIGDHGQGYGDGHLVRQPDALGPLGIDPGPTPWLLSSSHTLRIMVGAEFINPRPWMALVAPECRMPEPRLTNVVQWSGRTTT